MRKRKKIPVWLLLFSSLFFLLVLLMFWEWKENFPLNENKYARILRSNYFFTNAKCDALLVFKTQYTLLTCTNHRKTYLCVSTTKKKNTIFNWNDQHIFRILFAIGNTQSVIFCRLRNSSKFNLKTIFIDMAIFLTV